MSDSAVPLSRPMTLAAPVAALLYPWFLSALFSAGRLSGSIGAFSLAGALALVFAVPVLAFILALRLGKIATPSVGVARARIATHLAVAAPPLFTFVGVVTYMAGIANQELWIWSALWIMAIAWILNGGNGSVLPCKSSRKLAVIHGSVAAVVIVGFVLLHFANHLAGLWSAEAHLAVMNIVRKWYRSKAVEPLLVALMLFMAGSGFVLLRARLARSDTNFFDTLQTATGAYLLIYILGHMNSVFLYQRWFAHKETDFWFAAGGPEGLLGDPWSVRLLPHYFIGVWGITTHAACGLRQVMLAHGVKASTADRATIVISVAGALGATAMVLGLCRVHLGA